MTIVARRVPAVPAQTPVQAWDQICELLADSSVPDELQAARGVAALLITEEYTQDAPIIVSGVGPQVRLYTVHGDRAIEADPPPPLSFDPLAGEWRMSLPAAGADVQVAREQLAGCSARITVRDIEERANQSDGTASSSLATPRFNLTKLEQP